ncbi:MAG: hypothetical protein ABL965_07490 [Nitrospira sp.]|jgi:hypothetical protein|nr:MAG: hypothetical protein E8D44_13165 [Nitrospira sp.]
MPIVDRFFAQLHPEPEGSESTPQPLSHYYSHPAIVVLGDPGSGKSTSFEQSATTEPNAAFVPIRDFLTFQADRWEGKTLYLDGLDEQRAKNEDGRGALDRIRAKLDQLKRPRYRLSCRAADWYGESETERLRAVSPDHKVLVLRLEPLSDADIITIACDKLSNPADFLIQAQRRGIDPLLRNPQTLELIIAEVRDGVWPATRLDLFQKACERLLQETNPEHEQGQYVPLDRLLTAAGYLCAIHLCGGTKGHAVNTQDADEAFPYIGELPGDQVALSSAVRRRIFRGNGPGRVTPIHRTVAEYLSALFFAKHLRAGYPLKRMLTLLTGDDGGTLAELRGIYAWLACLYEEEAATLIRRDPLGLLLYGDASKLSTSAKRMVIDCLRDLAIKNPGFRAENWSAEPFGALASPDMVPVFRNILSDGVETPHLLGCILDAIEHGPPLPDLGGDLIRIVRDNVRLEGARVPALDAYRHVSPNDMETLRTLLDDIQQGRIHDEHHRLRGKLFYALYPGTIGPHEIGQYLILTVEPHVNAYTMFVSHELVRLTNPQDLPLLFTGIDAKKVAGSHHHHIWEDFFGRLILQILQHLGESASSSQLYEWLGKALDQYESPVADREEAAAIQSWLTSHAAVVQGLFRHWFSVTPFAKPRLEVHYFWRRLHGIAPPHGFHRWLLSLAEREPDPARAEFLFREAVQGSTSLLREDGPTLEDFFQLADRNPRFLDPLQMELCWDIPSWRQEDTERRRAKKQKDETERAIRIQNLSEQLETIRTGAPTNALVYLAKVYFGLFYELDRESAPRDRLIGFTTPEIAATALSGFVAALQIPDIPSPKMIGELEVEGKEYIIGFPILAGMDVLASNSFADVLLLPESTLQSGLAFHYAIITDREREWVDPLVEHLPSLAAEALIAYWRPHLAKNSKNIPGLYDLAHKEIMKPVAQRVSLILLKGYPNAQEGNLELLLHAALRNGDPQELLSYAHHFLTQHSTLTDDNRSLWYAVAFALDHESIKSGLAEHIGGKAEQAARVLGFLCPTHGVKSDTPYSLSVAALASLIVMLGPIFHPRSLSGSGYMVIRGPEEASSSIQSLIHRLGKELTYDASLALAALQDNPGLTAWLPEITYVLADQARQRRELAFQYPTVTDVIETLNQGRPANAADLQALVDSHLHTLSAELRDGPTDGWKGMWNVDGYGRPIQPRPENQCRDLLLELLRPRLFPIGVAAEPEGQYAEDKRADIKAIIGAINLPIEIKRHFHADIWAAPRDQLKKLYSRDPGAAGRGIYLVFWFGIGAGTVPRHPTGSVEIQTPAHLEAALLETLQHSERELLDIIVIDCAPSLAPEQAQVRKIKVQGESGKL